MALSDDLRYLIEYDIFKVLRILKNLVEELPRSIETRLLLGDAYLRGLQFDLAIEQYRAATALAPNARSPVLKLALCLVYTGHYPAALARFDELIGRGKDEHALALSGLLLHRLGRPAEAERRYRALIDGAEKTTSDVLYALQGLVFVLRDQQRVMDADIAAGRLLEHIARQPNEAPGWLHNLNNSYDYFEWSGKADKGQLAALLARHGGPPGSGWFFPETFVMPEQRAAFEDFAARQPPGRVYIVKPRRGQGGQGIGLTDRSGAAANAVDSVVQRYIENPYLIDGKKAHLRIYGLVGAGEPPRLYVYRDGIVRFAPEPYLRGPDWLARVAMHITNTAVHRGHPKLVISANPDEENVGNVWSLRAYLARLAADGHDADGVFATIARLVGHFVLMLRADGLFDRQRRMGPARGFVPKLFGLDVLLDQTTRPWLIEIQRSPAWNGPPLVKRINNTLAATLIRMSAGPLLSGHMPPERIAAVLGDPLSLEHREREVEYRDRGAFARLVYDPADLNSAERDILYQPP